MTRWKSVVNASNCEASVIKTKDNMQNLNRIPAIGREIVRTLGLLAFITVCLMSAQAQETPATAQAAPAQTPTADNQSAAPAAPAAPVPDPFVGPAITGPLQGLPPFRFDAG